MIGPLEKAPCFSLLSSARKMGTDYFQHHPKGIFSHAVLAMERPIMHTANIFFKFLHSLLMADAPECLPPQLSSLQKATNATILAIATETWLIIYASHLTNSFSSAVAMNGMLLV